MRRELLPTALWEQLAPLLPRHKPQRKGGRPYRDDRAALRGILFVLESGIEWESLPVEVFGVSGITCWRRLNEWTRAGVFERLERKLLNELGIRGCIDWTRAAFDASIIRAQKGDLKRAQAQSTEGKRAPSTTSSRTARASHWRSSYLQPTSRTSRNSRPSLMRFRLCVAGEADRADVP